MDGRMCSLTSMLLITLKKTKHKRVPQDSRQQLKKLRVGNRYLAYFSKVP